LEGLVKGFVSKGHLEKSMNILKRDLEKSMEVNLEKIMIGTVKTIDLITLEERIEKKME
jgi:predicted histidine transporter YuiF (NhaC family)